MSAGQLLVIKSRIKSVESTRKITRAMEMVSAAKLRRFQTMLNKTRPYTEALGKIISQLMSSDPSSSGTPQESQFTHPFFEKRKEQKAALLVITSDTGLCGAHNMFLIDLAKDFLARPAHQISYLYGSGKTGVNSLKRSNFSFAQTYINLKTPQIEPAIKEMRNTLTDLYLRKEVDAVYVIYAHVLSAMVSKPIVERILPLNPPSSKDAVAAPRDSQKTLADFFIYEPSPKAIFEHIVPEFFEAQLRMMFLESYVAEHMARMNAMHQATKNAKEMTESLTLVRNKIRQTIITKEIIEIISGSKASKK